MKFPNAARGVKKIFIAEILKLIAAAVMIIALILAIITAAGAKADPNINAGTAVAGLGTIMFMGSAGVIALIAGILSLIGIINASSDESSFRNALIAIIVSLVAAIVMSIFSTNAIVTSICRIIQTLMDIAVIVFVINGITNLADKLNNEEVGTKGRKLMLIIICVFVLALVSNIIVIFFGGMFASATAGVIALVASILDIIGYIVYLVLLAQAKQMLAEA